MTYLKAILAGLGIFALSSPAMAQLTKEESANLDRILAGIRADPDAMKKARLALGRQTNPYKTARGRDGSARAQGR
jgi:hypothetical protein